MTSLVEERFMGADLSRDVVAQMIPQGELTAGEIFSIEPTVHFFLERMPTLTTVQYQLIACCQSAARIARAAAQYFPDFAGTSERLNAALSLILSMQDRINRTPYLNVGRTLHDRRSAFGGHAARVASYLPYGSLKDSLIKKYGIVELWLTLATRMVSVYYLHESGAVTYYEKSVDDDTDPHMRIARERFHVFLLGPTSQQLFLQARRPLAPGLSRSNYYQKSGPCRA